MITDDLSPDPDDGVHAAAVMNGDVDVLFTRNIEHLRTKPVLSAGVKVITSDGFLVDLLKRRATAGAPKFAARLQAHLSGRPAAQSLGIVPRQVVIGP
jgi:hypothetical protein